MSEKKWTPEQKIAVEAESGALLVSAAAGSGKTSVLTERAVRKLTDSDERRRVKPEELLIVTFTNAAASEMRGRIYKRVNELLREAPESSFLPSLKMRLELAEICTIDSFCGRLVRENFHEAGVSPDFRILDNSETKILAAETVKLTIEELHKERGEAFTALCDMFAKGRDDSELAKSITKLCLYSYAYPFPSAWLEKVEEMFTGDMPENTVWGKLILDYAADAFEYCTALARDSVELAACEKDMEKAYGSALQSDLRFCETAQRLVCENNWDEAENCILSFKKESLGRLTNKELAEMKDTVQLRRKKIQSVIDDVKAAMCCNTAEHFEDISVLEPIVRELVYAVRLYSQRLLEAKRDMNAYNFSDIASFALALLAEKDGDSYKRTELACRLSENYKEIMIDEYQDTNEAQNMLFECLSRDGENLFTVGDVKQSIYKFRLAMPEIFNRKVLSYPYYNGSEAKSKIILGKNFRSSAGIINAVNTLFSRIMSKKAGEMEYSEDEQLCCGRADKPSGTPDVYLKILNMPQARIAGDRRALEADYAAKLIRSYIGGEPCVPDSAGGMRKARPGDFCILMRNTKGSAKIYADALVKNGLKCISESSSSFFDTREISVMLSLLRCADNPTREVELLTVMLSPVFGFTPDELAEIKTESRKTGLWRSVCIASENKPHFKYFADEMTELRRLAASLPAGEFVRTVYDRTAYTEIAFAENNDISVKNNLLLLQKYATDFDMRSPGAGLAGFVRYIDSVALNGESLEAAAPTAGEDAVRILTIHKSKGLEFPFVIIADTAHRFNDSDRRESLLISNAVGIGLRRKDRPTLRIFSTLPFEAVKIEQKRADISEELRILYVAMTRAREKLIMLCSLENADKKLAELEMLNLKRTRVEPFSVLKAGFPGEWLICGFMLAESGAADCSVVNITGINGEKESAELPEIPEALPDESLINEIRERAGREYVFAALAGAPAKRTASDLYADSFNEEFFASSVPAFMFGDSLSPAERGTATHRYLQYCDMQAAAASPEKELNRLILCGRLSEREASAVALDTVAAFFADKVYLRAAKAPVLYREKQFTVASPVALFEPELADIARDEVTVVIGEIDMLFIENGSAVIVDYKTDRVNSAEKLISRYSSQLRMYADAVRRSLCVPVSECIIYSLHMKKAVNVPFSPD